MMTHGRFVTVALRLTINPSDVTKLLDLYDELHVLEKSMTISGAIDTWIGHAVHAPDTVVVFTRWTDASSYDAWCSDTRRDEILRRLTPLLTGVPSAEIFESVRPAVSSNLA
jgi:hypothetical protein